MMTIVYIFSGLVLLTIINLLLLVFSCNTYHEDEKHRKV